MFIPKLMFSFKSLSLSSLARLKGVTQQAATMNHTVSVQTYILYEAQNCHNLDDS